MMGTDYKAFLAFLTAQGYTGQVNEGFHAFLKAQGYSGQLNEMAYKFLTNLGYTQHTLPEKYKAWLTDGLAVAADPYASLLALFDASEAGEVWPVHEDYLFTDTACTTPVSAVGDEVKGWLGAKYGIKLTQSTAGAIPRYARQPAGGWKQKLLETGNLTSSTWYKTLTTVAGGETDIDGGANAFRVTSTTTGGIAKCSQDIFRDGSTNTFSLVARPGNVNRIFISLERSNGTYADHIFDLSSGTWILTSGATTVSETALSGGRYRIEVHHAGLRASAEHWFGPISNSGTGVTSTTNGDYVIVEQPQVEAAAAFSSYEERGAAYEGPASGDSVAAIYFDGSNDFLASPAIDFTGTNKITLYTAWNKRRPANEFSVIAELSSDNPTTNGSFALIDNGGGSGDNSYFFAIRGTSLVEKYLTQQLPPMDRSTISVVYDIAGNNTTAITASVTTDSGAGTEYSALTNVSGTTPGTGNFGNQALYVGKRGGGGSGPSNGYMIGALVVLGRAPTGTEFADTVTTLGGLV